MARLYLFAEGTTEQTFANTVLIAHARKKGRIHRGGGRNFTAMQNDINRFLKQESGRDVFFTTMVDLYALHANFPGKEEAEKLRHDPYQRVDALEKSWFDETGDRRFIPFIQLHEFEAYLFVDVSQFAFFFDNANSQISALQDVQPPELIDDGQDTAPSKRIIAQFPNYSKTTVSPQMAELIGLENIRSKCPHFNAWLERLEKLGPKFDLTRALIEARIGAKLTQAQLAERMQTTQSVIARLESGRVHPSTKTLQKIAQATGTRLKISFETTGAPN